MPLCFWRASAHGGGVFPITHPPAWLPANGGRAAPRPLLSPTDERGFDGATGSFGSRGLKLINPNMGVKKKELCCAIRRALRRTSRWRESDPDKYQLEDLELSVFTLACMFVVFMPADDNDDDDDDSNLPQLTRPSILGVCLAF